MALDPTSAMQYECEVVVGPPVLGISLVAALVRGFCSSWWGGVEKMLGKTCLQQNRLVLNHGMAPAVRTVDNVLLPPVVFILGSVCGGPVMLN